MLSCTCSIQDGAATLYHIPESFRHDQVTLVYGLASKMGVLITGAAGFIGSHTVDAFLRQQHAVIGVDDLSTGRLQNLAGARDSRNFTFVRGDITDQAFVSSLISEHGVDRIIHLAGMAGVAQSMENPGENFRLNVAAVDTLARAAITNRCKKFVLASSAAVYGIPARLPLTEEQSPCTPLSPYGAAKLAAEKILEGYARAFGLECVILRYFNVYGPRQNPDSEYSGVISRFCAQLASGDTLTIYGDGQQTRDFIYVGDVAQVNLNAALAPISAIGVYNVSTGNETSINELAALLASQLGAEVKTRHVAAKSGDITQSLGDSIRLRSAGLISTFTPLRAGLQNTVHSPVFEPTK
ncbi:MAG: SDR family NAD(P)-dependent oxidoreductase [Gammaproteobacteria bacterium]